MSDTTADKLRYLAETKDLIRDAIEFKNVDVPNGATFRDYADLVRSIKNVDDTEGGLVISLAGYNIETASASIDVGDISVSASGALV